MAGIDPKNYAFWAGIVGAVWEKYQHRGANLKTVSVEALEKAVITYISTMIQSYKIPLVGDGLDGNYLVNWGLGALTPNVYKKGRSMVQAGNEQLLISLVAHRLASVYSTGYQTLTSNFPTFWPFGNGYNGTAVETNATGIPASSGNTSTY